MKKKIIYVISALLVFAAAFFIGFAVSRYQSNTKYRNKVENQRLSFASLDHDITISTDSTFTICDDQLTGWKASCGPSPAGWPMAFPFRWEVYCVESPNYYFARLIYHEYVLWMSFDQPYVLVKIPKCNTSADWKTNESARYTNLWDITSEFEKGYNDPKCINSPQVYNINGHRVSFGGNSFQYSKYVVVHDVNHPW